MLADLPGASAHVSRFRVVAIGLGAGSRAQVDPAPVVATSELLADAMVDAICWNGTSGAWLGLGVDRALCEAVTVRTGIPATIATLH
jgi:maleate isomerase